eukprot:TRINITY_DN4553_c0_g1_i1.p2 TRINITY_DN4553_c0_g1~~TRINITY_DN4553_c0_g1_i1.p2  ORF type:complete len:187 (-),score=19.17 TRINITY_DN4553_c0_g1_i1:86-646(-)
MSEKEKELKYYRELYKKLSNKYTKEELAESFVFPADMTEEEKKQADKELWEHRKQQLLKRKPEEKIYSNLLRLKYELEDYVLSKDIDEGKSISYYLNEYMKAIDRNQKELSEDIDIHPTRLSRILNGKERLSLSISYRLERHSGEIIEAILWWKLIQKEIEQEIIEGTEEKEKEKNRVKNVVYNRA